MKKILIIFSLLIGLLFTNNTFASKKTFSTFCETASCERTIEFDNSPNTFSGTIDISTYLKGDLGADNEYVGIYVNGVALYNSVGLNNDEDNYKFISTKTRNFDGKDKINIKIISSNKVANYGAKFVITYDNKLIEYQNETGINKKVLSKEFIYYLFTFELGISLILLIIVFYGKLLNYKGKMNLFYKKVLGIKK